MNQDTVQGNWQQLSGKIKQKWGKLTDDDLTRAQGDKEYLVGKLHEQYGIAKDRAEDELQTLGYREDDQCDGPEREGICTRDAEEEVAEPAGRHDRQGNAGRKTERCDRRRLAQHHCEQRLRPGSERYADAEFLRSYRNRKSVGLFD